MLYWMSKIFQATGLGLMGWGFVTHYPNSMPYKLLLASILIFIIGWLIQSYILKK